MKSPDKILDQLFESARKNPPDTSRQEYAFETRLMARLRETRQQTVPFLRIAWRIIPFLCLFVIALGIWSYQESYDSSVDLYSTAGNSLNGEWLMDLLPENSI